MVQMEVQVRVGLMLIKILIVVDLINEKISGPNQPDLFYPLNPSNGFGYHPDS